MAALLETSYHKKQSPPGLVRLVLFNFIFFFYIFNIKVSVSVGRVHGLFNGIIMFGFNICFNLLQHRIILLVLYNLIQFFKYYTY